MQSFAIKIAFKTYNYNFFASLIVSGNFFLFVSGSKSTRTAAINAEPPNNKAGSDLNCEPYKMNRIIQHFKLIVELK